VTSPHFGKLLDSSRRSSEHFIVLVPRVTFGDERGNTETTEFGPVNSKESVAAPATVSGEP